MLSEFGTALSLLALGGLAVPAAAPVERTIEVALCNGGTRHIPIKGKPERSPGDCAGACHMLTGRRRHLATGCDAES